MEKTREKFNSAGYGSPLVGGFVDPDPNRILLADLSRQRMTLDTVNHLLRLASARDVRGLARTMAWGQNDRSDPVLPSRIWDADAGGCVSAVAAAVEEW